MSYFRCLFIYLALLLITHNLGIKNKKEAVYNLEMKDF